MDIKTIRHISRTNSLLRPQDIASIRKVGEQCQQDLTTWMDKIEATKIFLSTLESRVQETKKDIVLCAALSSTCHVRHLPSELLSLVFSFACTGDKLDLFFKRRNRPPTALTLVRVCKYWRDIALGTRSVWSHPIIFDKERRLRSILLMEEEEEMYGRQVQETVKLYGSNLSHVHLHYDRTFSLRRIVDEVFDNQRHLVSFHFFGEGNFMFQGKAGVRKFDMPLLEELLISSSHWYDAKVLVRIPFKVPNLSRLFLLNPDTSGFFIDRFLLPWQQIMSSDASMTHCKWGEFDG
ncbi:hypothetical protein FA13DRAFT_16561 [Coprinellus micaceus]|uniref:F-box domain-containing protein n=1 Tax=Coprinellus micaceus TaxID=71717 RepID=A0A4Y7TZP5_COPMI|nr:hypothetical protein FA13DRAFT_16561 [Coprinellus micaceus]